MGKTNFLLGIAIGGTKSAVTLGSFDGENLRVIEKTVTATYPENAEKTLDGIITAINNFDAKFSRIGVICGSPLDVKKGIINSPPNLPGFKNFKITEILSERYGVPCTLLNDADACAVAEWKFGAGKNLDNVVFLTCGTGFGAGLILNGKLYTGALGMAGEIGHVRLDSYGNCGYGKTGSCEGYLSGTGIIRTARVLIDSYIQRGEKTLLATTLSDADKVTAKEVYACAEKGDKCAIEIFDLTAKKLGETLAILVDVLNPDAIILGGVYHRCIKYLESGAIKKLKEECLLQNFDAVKIIPSKLKEEIDEYSSLCACLV